MKKVVLITWVILLFFISLFSSCNNEVFDGEFIESFPCENTADIGELRVLLDTLNFRGIISETKAEFVIHPNGFVHIAIFSLNDEGELLYININSPEVGVFDLATTNEGGFIFPGNHPELLTNFGHYALNADEFFGGNGYSTFTGHGGFGEFEITKMDFEENLISGNFSFSARRSKKDSVTGEVIFNENGNPIIETVEITCGSINDIPFEQRDEGDQPYYFTEFYAEVDGEEFVEHSLTAGVIFTGNNENEVINIEARTFSGRMLRIDIPLELEEGTYAFEALSDGTRLTAIYNNNANSEALTANPGSITITDFDKIQGTIEANFSFTGTDPLGIDPTVVEVTNGMFKLSYNTSASLNYLVADVDNEEYFLDDLFIVQSNVLGVDVVTINTNGGGFNGLDLILPKYIEEGSYNMTSNWETGNEKIGLFSPNYQTDSAFRSNSGTLTIISNDVLLGVIEGNFEFVASDIYGIDPTEYTITNGAFLVHLY